jgi:RHH-type transcriptional regulator, rel operon repressor / antitoxin RelB
MAHAKTISFRAETEKIKVLDSLAALQDRDRTYLLNEALDHYLELNQYHLDEIRAGVKQADAGKLVDNADLKRHIAKWRKKR